jgi:hypothetical protein
LSIGYTGSVDKLIDILPAQAPFVQIAIINLIAKCDNQNAIKELEKFQQSEIEDIRKAAREALEARHES